MSTSEHAVRGDDRNLPSFVDAISPRNNRVLGFWIFLSGECAFFASLIGTYLALHTQTAGGPTAAQMFDLPTTMAATFTLLSSSLTGVMATWELQRGNIRNMQWWLLFTALLGLFFLEFQGVEFWTYYHHGMTLSTSAWSSAFYALVGFHGMHVTFGVFWLTSLLAKTIRDGVSSDTASKLYIAGLYWHFVDVVWVVIFTVVYLMGVH